MKKTHRVANDPYCIPCRHACAATREACSKVDKPSEEGVIWRRRVHYKINKSAIVVFPAEYGGIYYEGENRRTFSWY